MGLPIWVDPSESKSRTACCSSSSVSANPKPPSDLTQQHRAARSAIRRQHSVRYSHGARPSHLHPPSQQYLRGTLRSPPPPTPPSRDIPPVPSLPSQPRRALSAQRHGRDSPPDVVLFPPAAPAGGGGGGGRPPAMGEHDISSRTNLDLPSQRTPPRRSTSHGGRDSRLEPFSFSEFLNGDYRPRSRHGTITNEQPTASPSAIDELPPLRRMNHRSINDARSPPPPRLVSSHDHGLRPSERYRFENIPPRDTNIEGLGDRTRSVSPAADQWETLLTTITPDPSLPSASTSFNSAAASFPRGGTTITSTSRPRSRVLRPIETPLSPLSQPNQPPITIVPSSPSSSPSTSSHLNDDDDDDEDEPPAEENCEVDTLFDHLRNLHSHPSPPSHDQALQALDNAILDLRARFHRLVNTFVHLADSFRRPDDPSSTPPPSADPRPHETEVVALAADVRAVLHTLESTIRERADLRARRVSLGADPLAAVRALGDERSAHGPVEGSRTRLRASVSASAQLPREADATDEMERRFFAEMRRRFGMDDNR